MTIRSKTTPTAAMKKRGGIGSMASGKPTATPKATGRTVYKSRTTIPTRLVGRVANTQVRKDSSPAAIKRKPFKQNPKTAMKQRQQAKALTPKPRQGTNQATPTKTTGTLVNPISAQKQMPRTTSSVSDRLKKIVGSAKAITVAKRKAAAIARRKAAAKTKPQPLQISKPLTTQTPRQKAIAAVKARSAAKRAAILKKYKSLTPLQRASMAQTQRARATTGNPTSAQKEINNTNMQKVKQLSAPQKQMPRTTPSKVGSTAANRRAAAMARRTNAKLGRPTGRTVYKSRTTIPTRRRRK